MANQQAQQIPRPSRKLLWLFRLYLRWYFARQFHGLRIAHAERFAAAVADQPDMPTLVLMNHPSWWDALTCLEVSQRLFPEHDHYGPMDSVALDQYSFFARLGCFPVQMGTQRGAAQFLQAAKQIATRPHSMLWIMPQGQFKDARLRPAGFLHGAAALATRLSRCRVLPLAVEYTHWDERLPEALLLCGESFEIAQNELHTQDSLTQLFEQAVTSAQDELAALAIERDASQFKTLQQGRVGTAFVYDGWRRLRAIFSGVPYVPQHTAISRREGRL